MSTHLTWCDNLGRDWKLMPRPQQISVHAAKYPTASCWTTRQNPRYPENTGNSPLPKVKEGRRRAARDHVRAKRHLVCEGRSTTYRRSLPVVRRKCHASISHSRGRGASFGKAINGKAEPSNLRGGLGFPERADHGKSPPTGSNTTSQRQFTDNPQTLEVAFARVYNWDVAQRRKEREGGSIEGKQGGSQNG